MPYTINHTRNKNPCEYIEKIDDKKTPCLNEGSNLVFDEEKGRYIRYCDFHLFLILEKEDSKNDHEMDKKNEKKEN